MIEVGEDRELPRYIEKPVYEYLVSIGVNVISNSALATIGIQRQLLAVRRQRLEYWATRSTRSSAFRSES